ncbi:PiggyBac transposable element-derived protein 4 [Merluccius polli]|uniref:PiggyBac transposable element-derived protein 4 n=1 Tax=Merluccius polli TaxID=89951 RepID=A0AA47NY05_MERPO|nr:PiggyBac transposable element-derived protein 4 [Merluccius polli]
MDTREVSLCSTIHPVYSGDTVQRWKKTGDGPHQLISIPRPTTVTEYNRYMGGVDTSDQMIGTNSVHRKIRRWPTTVFQHLVDIAVTNSFIIHKECASLQQERPMTVNSSRRSFLQTSLELTGEMALRRRVINICNNQRTDKSSESQLGATALQTQRSTAWQCEDCNVGLCLQPDRYYHWLYHQGL